MDFYGYQKLELMLSISRTSDVQKYFLVLDSHKSLHEGSIAGYTALEFYMVCNIQM